MKKTIKRSIVDPMGLNTGIAISDVHLEFKPENDEIRINGYISASRNMVFPFEQCLEPEIYADIMDTNQHPHLLGTAEGRHKGHFWTMRHNPFEINISQVSKNYAKWEAIGEVKIHVLF